MSSCSLMHRVFPPSKLPDGGYQPSFRLIVGGTQLRGSWYLSAIVRLQGFSSASPAVPPRRRSPKTVTTSSWVGRSKPGCDLGPTLSFKMFIILAGVGAGLSRRSTSRAGSWVTLSRGVRGRGRSLALRAATASCAREDHPRCRALLGRRSCSGVVLPLHRRGIFTRRPVPHSSGRI
jgi:hypothetical protein